MNGDDVLRRLDLYRREAQKQRKPFVDFQRLQMQYGFECFLRRLEKSSHRSTFILKGAMLLTTLKGFDTRNTKDMDFQVYGEYTATSLKALFAEICSTETNDGIEFVVEGIDVEGAGATREYPGFEVHVPATLGKSNLKLQFDIGFGEVVTPGPAEIEIPVLLGLPRPKVRAYPWETVIAEKFEAIVSLGMRNNRMKDFFDIADLASRLEFDGDSLGKAIRRTFEHRKTVLPGATPVGLSDAFLLDRAKRRDWTAFLSRHCLSNRLKLAECGANIVRFVMPVVQALVDSKPLPGHWVGRHWS